MLLHREKTPEGDHALETKILIVAGGTGGHISPGIALYEELSSEFPVYILSLIKNRDYPDFRKNTYPVFFYDAPPLSKNLIRFFYKFMTSLLFSFRLIRKYRFRIIISTGGYPAVPALLAAILLRKKIYLCEPNAYPGTVTRWFYRFSEKIFLAFPLPEKFRYLQNKAVITGNPVRKELFQKARTKKERKKVKTILLTGGSQGARQLNYMVIHLWKKYPGFCSKFDWIVQTGIPHEKDFGSSIEEIGFRKRITFFGFTTEIADYFLKADILITRAGAGIISEGLLFQIPMILIPYPYAKDNHQLYNARSVEERNLGIVVNTASTDPEMLFQALQKMLKSYEEYRKAFAEHGYHRNPASIIKEFLKN